MSSREAFEKWAEGEGFSLRRAANYCEWEARSLWEAWQRSVRRPSFLMPAPLSEVQESPWLLPRSERGTSDARQSERSAGGV